MHTTHKAVKNQSKVIRFFGCFTNKVDCIFSFFTLREEDKNIFDYCRENNIDHISKAISSQKLDVNTKDEEVTTARSA